MRISYNWLKDFVDIKISPKVLADKLTMAGLEVTSLEQKGKDVVFEIEVTANRPDCLSVLGIAQEVAAITKAKFTPHSRAPYKSEAFSTGRVGNIRMDTPCVSMGRKMKKGFMAIQDTNDCAFYRGCLIVGVKIGQSPEWLRNRIEAVGIRPVNNTVDITNYCLMEFGQPLHAFDYDKITERIIVRRAKDGEKILTIDGTERQLSKNFLVISDKNKAIAIAGIMGDKLSEVGTQTKNILLESAYFDPILIRRGSRELGLTTDSSYRFERQVDFQRVIQAQDRAVELICELAEGKFIDEKQDGSINKPKEKTIKFNCSKANKFLCLNVSLDSAKKIFCSLGFSCKNIAKDTLEVKIPAIRRDINLEEDLFEELARIYGYENIPSTLPAIRSNLIENIKSETLKPAIREILCGLGFNEVINYSLMSKDMIDAACINKEAIKLFNPLSNEQEYLRPMLLPGFLNCLTYNLNHKNTDLKLFEIGHVFGDDYSEDGALGLLSIGKQIDNWQIKKEANFFTLKGSVQNLIERLGFGEISFTSSDNNMFVGGESANIICQGKEIGVLGKIDKKVLLNFGIKNSPSVYYAEISPSLLSQCARREVKFEPLPIYPSVTRDLSLIVKQSVRYEEITKVIRGESTGYLKNIQLIDTYKGEQIQAGSFGMTISLEFGLGNRTLTDEEVVEIQGRIVKKLKSELAAQIR